MLQLVGIKKPIDPIINILLPIQLRPIGPVNGSTCLIQCTPYLHNQERKLRRQHVESALREFLAMACCKAKIVFLNIQRTAPSIAAEIFGTRSLFKSAICWLASWSKLGLRCVWRQKVLLSANAGKARWVLGVHRIQAWRRSREVFLADQCSNKSNVFAYLSKLNFRLLLGTSCELN